jgi:hypothetical protein
LGDEIHPQTLPVNHSSEDACRMTLPAGSQVRGITYRPAECDQLLKWHVFIWQAKPQSERHPALTNVYPVADETEKDTSEYITPPSLGTRHNDHILPQYNNFLREVILKSLKSLKFEASFFEPDSFNSSSDAQMPCLRNPFRFIPSKKEAVAKDESSTTRPITLGTKLWARFGAPTRKASSERFSPKLFRASQRHPTDQSQSLQPNPAVKEQRK